MAVSTYKTYLLAQGSTGDIYKLPDIKDYSDLDGEPELLETTTLANSRQTNIKGIQSSEGHTFTMNYSLADYTVLKALADSGKAFYFYVPFDYNGTSSYGSDGGVKYKGTCNIQRTGKGVNEVREMVFTVYDVGDSTDILSAVTCSSTLSSSNVSTLIGNGMPV